MELDWFIAHLDGQKQCCKVNGKRPNIQDIKYGVAKGPFPFSYLGPPLFFIYINDLPFTLQRTKVTMYADDRSISYTSRSDTDLTNAINSDLQDCSTWFQGNKLTLNAVKPQSMIFVTEPNLRKIYLDTSTKVFLFFKK